MENRMGTRKVWTILEVVSAVLALGLFLIHMSLWEQYAHSRPTVPDPAVGRIYALNEHGVVVYLNSAEKYRLDLFIWAAGGCFLLAILIGVFLRKSWRRPDRT